MSYATYYGSCDRVLTFVRRNAATRETFLVPGLTIQRIADETGLTDSQVLSAVNYLAALGRLKKVGRGQRCRVYPRYCDI